MGVLRLAAVLLAFAAPAAAQNTYVGGAVGDWHVGANWSAGVPGPADTVLLDADALVVAYATNPLVNVAALTVGDALGTFAPVLRLSTAASLGVATFHPRAALQLDTTAQISATDLFLAAGSSVTAYTGPTALGGGAVRLVATGTLSVAPGSTVTVRGQGYAVETGPGAAARWSGPAAAARAATARPAAAAAAARPAARRRPGAAGTRAGLGRRRDAVGGGRLGRRRRRDGRDP